MAALVTRAFVILHQAHELLAKLLQRTASWTLKAGPLPKHVAFIMDGNRRYAERQHMPRINGHQQGYSKMVEALDWCLRLGITTVSVYAFSIENFRREPSEVALLMQLAEQKLDEILQESDLLERHGVQVRVLGDLGLLPPGVRAAAARCMAATAHHRGGVLNICFAYTATQEMGQAVSALQSCLASGELLETDVTPDLLQQCLYTRECPPVDLVIRTSGESRLSDFLLIQSTGAHLHFAASLWPDFSYLDMLAALREYQIGASHLERVRAACEAGVSSDGWVEDRDRDAGFGVGDERNAQQRCRGQGLRSCGGVCMCNVERKKGRCVYEGAQYDIAAHGSSLTPLRSGVGDIDWRVGSNSAAERQSPTVSANAKCRDAAVDVLNDGDATRFVGRSDRIERFLQFRTDVLYNPSAA